MFLVDMQGTSLDGHTEKMIALQLHPAVPIKICFIRIYYTFNYQMVYNKAV
jgi:hypothetical protein